MVMGTKAYQGYESGGLLLGGLISDPPGDTLAHLAAKSWGSQCPAERALKNATGTMKEWGFSD